jgi:hypothetical protein
MAVAESGGFRQEQPVARRWRPVPRRAVRMAQASLTPDRLAPRPKPDRVRVTREQAPAMVRIASASVDAAGATGSRWRAPWQAPARAVADPLDVAEALVEAQQDAASDRVRGQLLLLAREVARVGGEVPAPEDAAEAAGT